MDPVIIKYRKLDEIKLIFYSIFLYLWYFGLSVCVNSFVQFVLYNPNCLFLTYCGEPAISHDSHHVSLVQWTNPLLLSQGTWVQIPWGVLMWNWDSPVSVVSLHWYPRRDWSSTGLRPQLSLGPRADNVTIPLDLTQPSCPGFTLAAGLPFGFTTNGVGCWGGALWRACNLTWFSPCLTGSSGQR